MAGRALHEQLPHLHNGCGGCRQQPGRRVDSVRNEADRAIAADDVDARGMRAAEPLRPKGGLRAVGMQPIGLRRELAEAGDVFIPAGVVPGFVVAASGSPGR